MRPIMPSVTIPGDREDRIMARSGDIVGYSRSRVVWRFGFASYSDAANAYGVSSPGLAFLFVLADNRGRELARYAGAAYNMPERFRKIINDPLRTA